MQNNQRKLANIFRDLLEKAIMPEIKRNDTLAASCQYFSNILNQQPLDFMALQAIVDTFPANKIQNTIEQPKTPPVFTKKKEQNQNTFQFLSENATGFNPSRTFGGQRSRYNMFQPKRQQPNVETSSTGNEYKTPLQSQPSKSLGNMENIYRIFLENQQKLQQMVQQPPQTTYTARVGGITGQDRQYY